MTAVVLSFSARVTQGCGRFALEMVVPGRTQLGPAAPADWPDVLHPGTLNVGVAADGWPDALAGERQIEQLDDGMLQPALAIPHHKIKGNTLSPQKSGDPRRGTGQAWRAQLLANEGSRVATCWMFRRIGSGYRDVIELVSRSSLRAQLSLTDDDPVVVSVLIGTQTGDWPRSPR